MSAANAPTRDEAFARIRLLRSPNIGPISYYHLLLRFGTAGAAIDALPDLAARGRSKYKAIEAGRVEAEIAAVRAAGARYLFHDSPDYPALLSQIEGAPPILTIRGDIALAARPCVAMVGARNASAAAIKLARDLSAGLAGDGFTVVSGLARGIDGACHEGAFPNTIGVIASGIDTAYPPQHADLQNRIAEGALLIAEEPPGSEPRGQQFPKRNRIIAGLAAGTLVVEAAPRSGSLITARLAGEAGREVMAIPGSPLDSRSHGCNQLIRDGAVLVQSSDDVAELLSGFDGVPRSAFREDAPEFRVEYEEPAAADPADIAALLTTAPVAIDELIRQSGEGASAVQLALLELEIAGRLVRHAGARAQPGRMSRVSQQSDAGAASMRSRVSHVTVGRILAETFALIRKNWRPCLLFVMFFSTFGTVGDWLMSDVMFFKLQERFDDGLRIGTLTLGDEVFAALVLAWYLAVWLLAMAACYFLIEIFLEDLGVEAKRQKRRIVPYLFQIILIDLAAIAGLLLLVVPGMILFARWSMAQSILIARSEGVVPAMKSSWRVTKGSSFAIAISQLAIMSVGILLAIGLMLAEIDETLAGFAIVETFGNVFYVATSALAVALLGLLDPPPQAYRDIFA